MRVVVDSSVLLLFLRPGTPPPRDAHGTPVPEYAAERVEHLIRTLEASGATVVVPTPVLAEILVRAAHDEAATILRRLNGAAVFEIASFDERAAVELADLMRIELTRLGRRKLRDEAETWAKLKFDRQIIAIAKVCGAATIYSHDAGIQTVAGRLGIEVLRLDDLPLAPEMLQRNMLEGLDPSEST